MLRSMYSGISGMKNFQTKLDVIGNNIANVSTSGFKKGRATFQDMMAQTTASAQGATANRGGINASQVGLGSQVGSIDNIHTQGFQQTTNNPLDMAIEGDGMFVVRSGDGTEYYTRAGNFYLDEDGAVVNSSGFYLRGFEVNADGTLVLDNNGDPILDADNIIIPADAQSFNIQTDGTVNIVNAQGIPEVVGKIGLANFSNPAGLELAGNNLYLITDNAGDTNIGIPEVDGRGGIVSNALEMSNVDLAEEFTEMIAAQRGFQANTRIITTSDEILQELVNLKR